VVEDPGPIDGVRVLMVHVAGDAVHVDFYGGEGPCYGGIVVHCADRMRRAAVVALANRWQREETPLRYAGQSLGPMALA
jgi:hypothetical protein